MRTDAIHSCVAENEPDICQIVIRKNGEEIYSDVWNGYRRDDCVHTASVTKSITALLVGIAGQRRKYCSELPRSGSTIIPCNV